MPPIRGVWRGIGGGSGSRNGGIATLIVDNALIVRDERTGKPYTPTCQVQLQRRIRKAAGLPADLKFTSFRHGGITEIGESGTDDVRAVSGHSTLEVSRIYDKANQEKARRIASRRREHITLVSATTSHVADG